MKQIGEFIGNAGLSAITTIGVMTIALAFFTATISNVVTAVADSFLG